MNKILTTDYPEHAAKLRKKCKSVKNPQATDIIILKQTMSHICKQRGVAGIAANQLGHPYRLFALSTGQETEPLFFFNPRIVAVSEEVVDEAEGCLSVPGCGGVVGRHDRVTLEWRDHNKKKLSFEFFGFWAKAVQHEMDHLDGVLYIDKCDAVMSQADLEKAFDEAQKAANLDSLAQAAEDQMTTPLKELEKQD